MIALQFFYILTNRGAFSNKEFVTIGKHLVQKFSQTTRDVALKHQLPILTNHQKNFKTSSKMLVYISAGLFQSKFQ